MLSNEGVNLPTQSTAILRVVLLGFFVSNISKTLRARLSHHPQPPVLSQLRHHLRRHPRTRPAARFIMPFHANQNCSCMERNLERISSGAVIYKLFLRP